MRLVPVPPPAVDLAPDLARTEVAATPSPKLVMSGRHSAGFDAICNDLAE